MSQLSCKNLCCGYDGKSVSGNIDFAVNSGDYLCIIGENGSGKSTLMKTILGLIPPVSGSVCYDEGLKKNKIGYLPQQTVVQRDFPASVTEIVMSGFCGANGVKPFYSKKQKCEAEEKMQKMGILKFKDRCYRELSGGQQQRVLLSRALCATEKMILLDEPVAGLDPKVTAEMYELISNINKSGTTVIMISHDIDSALKYSSHILNVGKNMFFGAKEDYLKFIANTKNGGDANANL